MSEYSLTVTYSVRTITGDPMSIRNGEATTLNCTAKIDGTATDITGATFTSYFPKANGQYLSIANGSHAIVSAAAGTFTITVSAANSALLPAGKAIPFYTEITIAAVTRTYFGEIEQIFASF